MSDNAKMYTGKIYPPENKPFLFPIKRLFYSRKFMVLLFDVIISTILYFVGKYSASGIADDIGFLIGAYQPVALLMIYTIAQEDIAIEGNREPKTRSINNTVNNT